MAKRHKSYVKYIDVFFPGIYVGITFSAKKFLKECKRLNIHIDDPNPNKRPARIWSFTKENYLTMILLFDLDYFGENVTKLEEYGLLVHEVSHLWRDICEHIGEYNPSNELNSYHLQRLFLDVAVEYEKQREKNR